MRLNVKLYKPSIIFMVAILILFTAMAMKVNAIIATGNTTVDGTTRSGEITDFTQTAPYIIANRTTLFIYAITDSSGLPITNVISNMTINNTVFNLTYSFSLNTYNTELYFNSSEMGDYPFTIQAEKIFYDIPDYTATYFVRNFVKVCFNIWKEKNKTRRYDNRFAHLFIIPHNKSSSMARIDELAYPFEFMLDTFYTKINRYTFLPDKEQIASLEAGFHKEISTSGSTCIALPNGEAFTSRIIQGRNLEFYNNFYSRYRYESLAVNAFLLTEQVTEDTTLDVYVTDFDLNPVITTVQAVLWILAIILIFVIPITIAIRQGKPREAMLAMGALIVVIPAITFLINKIIGWIFT